MMLQETERLMRYMVGAVNLFDNTLQMTEIEANNERDAIAIWCGEGPGYFGNRSMEEIKKDFFDNDILIEVVKI